MIKGCGSVKLDGKNTVVLDCSYAEAQEFSSFLVLCCASVPVEKVRSTL